MAPKRAASKASGAKAPPKKAAKKEEPMLTAVVEGLQASVELPDAAKEMLAAGARGSLNVYSEERHEHQVLVIGLIEEALQASLKRIEAKLASEEGSAAGADAQKATLAEAISACKAKADAAADVVVERETELATLTDAMMAQRREVAALQSQQRDAEAAKAECEEERTELSRIMAEHFAIVEAGELEAADTEVHAAALSKVGESLKLDESLQLALTKTCSKKKAERGPFDEMVLNELGSSLRAHHAQLDNMIADHGSSLASKAEAVSAKESQVAEAEAAQKAAAAALASARAEMDGTTAELQKAKESLKSFEREFSAATQGRDEAKAELDNFKVWNLGSFEVLKNRTRPPKPAEKPAEAPVEEAVEEAAGADDA